MENNYLNTTTNVYYGTLTDALAYIPVFAEGDTVQTIEVQNSRTEPADKAPTLAANKQAIIDLNGQTVTLNSTLTNNGILEIKDTETGGTLTRDGDVITNNNANATLTVSSGTINAISGYAIYNKNGGNVTIAGGNIFANSHAVYNASTGTIETSGGNISSNSGNAIRNRGSGTVNINGGTLTTGNGQYAYGIESFRRYCIRVI